MMLNRTPMILLFLTLILESFVELCSGVFKIGYLIYAGHVPHMTMYINVSYLSSNRRGKANWLPLIVPG